MRNYVNDWIVGIEEVTALAHEVEAVAKSRGTNYPPVPEEREYPVPEGLRRDIGMA